MYFFLIRSVVLTIARLSFTLVFKLLFSLSQHCHDIRYFTSMAGTLVQYYCLIPVMFIFFNADFYMVAKSL